MFALLQQKNQYQDWN